MTDVLIPTLWNEARIRAKTKEVIGPLSDACWEWQGPLNYKGYGRAHLGRGKQEFVHRRMFELAHGYLPPVVMHVCDNRRCVHPSHLKAGDNYTNVQDRQAKERQFKKLTDAEVAEIIAGGKWGSYYLMADAYGVDHSRIYQILKNGGRHVVR